LPLLHLVSGPSLVALPQCQWSLHATASPCLLQRPLNCLDLRPMRSVIPGWFIVRTLSPRVLFQISSMLYNLYASGTPFSPAYSRTRRFSLRVCIKSRLG